MYRDTIFQIFKTVFDDVFEEYGINKKLERVKKDLDVCF